MAKEEAQNPAEGKLKALQAAMSKIEKDFGKGSIMRMGDEQIENVEVIPSGSIGLDVALGVGGRCGRRGSRSGCFRPLFGN